MFAGTGIGSMVFFNFCYFGSINRTSLSVATALLYTAPAFVAIMARVFLKEKLTTKHHCNRGCNMWMHNDPGFMTSGFKIDGLGLLLGLGSGALYSIFGKVAINKGYSDETITLYTFMFCALATF